MALERLVLLQKPTSVNMIYSTLIIHWDAIKILHFDLYCTYIVYNLYRAHCFANNSGLLSNQIVAQYSYKHHTLKLYNRKHGGVKCIVKSGYLSGRFSPPHGSLGSTIDANLVQNCNSYATICECKK